MNPTLIKKTYTRLAPLYDAIFGAILNPGRKQSIQKLRCLADQDILEVGVGTGLSLELYPETVKVVGIDICPGMLQRAHERVESRGLDNVKDLLPMDARQMSFENDSFDKVVAMYVIPALDDPRELVAEMRRVCKPDGELVFINHFQSSHPFVRIVEAMLTPFLRSVKYRNDLKLEDFLRNSKLEVIETHDTNLFGYATMVRCMNHESQELTPNESNEYVGELLAEET